MLHHSFAGYLLASVLSVCWLPISVAQDETAENEQGADTAETTEPDQQQATEDQRKLDEFFEEAEELLARGDDFELLLQALQDEIKREFRETEGTIQELNAGTENDRRRASELRDQQIIRAQKHLDLELRRCDRNDWRGGGRQTRELNQLAKKFRKEEPKLCRSPEFQRRFAELTHQAMQMRGPMHHQHMIPSVLETLNALSSAEWQHVERQILRVTHPAVQDGMIQELRSQLQDLIKLEWHNDGLRLSRNHWAQAFAGETSASIKRAVDEMLRDAGHTTVEDEQEPVSSFLRTSNVARLFRELKSGSTRSARGGSGDKNNMDNAFQTQDLRARIKMRDGDLELTLEELTEPHRLFRLIDKVGKLEILLVGKAVHRFVQTDKRTQVTDLFDDIATTHSYDSFAELYSEQPRFVEERLFAMLDHLGILLPTARFDAEVTGRVLQKLRWGTDAMQEQADQLLADLDSRRYAVREAAFKQLDDNLDTYSQFLYAAQYAPTLSVEARSRVRRLLKNNATRESAPADQVISALGLLDSPEYLEQLAELVEGDEVKLIEDRLLALRQPASP